LRLTDEMRLNLGPGKEPVGIEVLDAQSGPWQKGCPNGGAGEPRCYTSLRAVAPGPGHAGGLALRC
jgi:hypothetical protein